ncbi:MAG: AAA family ATPase, partial [Clostridium sp.]
EFENISEEELGMILDDNDIQKIREVYQKNDQYFYQILQNLELLNISEALKKERIDNIRDEYISERVEDNYLNNQFSIQDIEFDNDITYRYISEGELQLFETLGAIILFQSREYQKENLYIFDEPTTHLNVNWLTKYITLLKETLKIIPSERVEPVNSQIIFSTHNSDIMIDLPKANLHLIKNGEFKSISEETFGGSELKLNRVYFNKLDSVSENVMREIEKELKKIESETNIKELKKIERRIEVKFANSPEKYNLLRSIEERAFELEENE